jgi:hypothetical protein
MLVEPPCPQRPLQRFVRHWISCMSPYPSTRTFANAAALLVRLSEVIHVRREVTRLPTRCRPVGLDGGGTVKKSFK